MRRAPGLAIALGLALAALAQADGPALKRAFAGTFRIGAALNAAQFTGQSAAEAALVAGQFDSISPENVLKWESVHPQPGRFRFDLADRYVRFGEDRGMWIVGHTLVWHEQTPAWVFEGGRDAVLARMREHILTVVGRYRGRIRGWDVVNEALDHDGTLRRSPWLAVLGEDYISKAFEFAHQADPACELYYTDYGLEFPLKRQGAMRLLRKLRAQGVPVKAVGLHGHLRLDGPPASAVGAAIEDFAALGLRVNVSELDVDVLPRPPASGALDPYAGGLPGAVQRALARRYGELFATFVAHARELDRVTFWGVTDAGSWLNDWPVPGRTNHPLLFDRRARPKPAFDAVVATARK